MSVERLSTYALRIHNWLHVERHHHKWKRGQQRFLFLSILKPSHQCLIVRCARNYLPRRASGCHWSIMSSADTRDWATAWGYFPVRSIATFAALKNFCAASLYTIAYSHRLRPVFQTFCLTSSPYLLELFFFRKKKNRPRRLRVPFNKRDFAPKSRNIAEDVAGLRVITLSVPHRCAHLNVTM